jgi:hypothetical protein
LGSSPEASCFHDALCRFHEGIHRECSLRRRGFGVSHSYLVATATRLIALVFGLEVRRERCRHIILLTIL